MERGLYASEHEAFQDARVQKIYGGTDEIMKQIIGREISGRR